MWDFLAWNRADVPYLLECQRRVDDLPSLAIGDRAGLQYELDRLVAEAAATDRNTAVRPEAVRVVSRSMPAPLVWNRARNILTTAGMAEMAKSRTGQTSSTNSHHGIGTGTVSETLGDTSLGTEEDRKSVGSRSVSGTTERYTTAFSDADVSGLPKDITEAGIFTAASGGIMIARVTANAVRLSSGRIITVGTTVSHENGEDA